MIGDFYTYYIVSFVSYEYNKAGKEEWGEYNSPQKNNIRRGFTQNNE